MIVLRILRRIGQWPYWSGLGSALLALLAFLAFVVLPGMVGFWVKGPLGAFVGGLAPLTFAFCFYRVGESIARFLELGDEETTE